jgi:periplasmic copper chaperone A
MLRAFLVLTLLLLSSAPVLAQDSALAVTKLRASEGMKGPRPLAMFFTVENSGTVDDELVAVASPVCGRAELHTHLMDNGIMKMRKIDAIKIPAGGKAALRPMGDHVMCFDVLKDMKNGDRFEATLTFKNAGTVNAGDGVIKTISVLSADINRQPAPHHQGH